MLSSAILKMEHVFQNLLAFGKDLQVQHRPKELDQRQIHKVR